NEYMTQNKEKLLKKMARFNVHTVPHRESLSVYVADHLEELLLCGDIVVGQKLPTENELSELFGVSRTVVREAVMQLKSMGLVETLRGIGTTVIRTTHADEPTATKIDLTTVENILHALELRLFLEPAAAMLAAERHNDNDRRKLI